MYMYWWAIVTYIGGLLVRILVGYKYIYFRIIIHMLLGCRYMCLWAKIHIFVGYTSI